MLTRIALRILVVILTTGALFALGLVIALYTGHATWIVNRLLQQVNPYPHTILRTARVTGDFVSGFELHDVRLARANGEAPLRLAILRVRYDLRSLFGDEIAIGEVQLVRPKIMLQQLPNSSWDLVNRRHRTADSSTSRGRRITIRRISIADGGALLRFGGARAGSTLRVEDVEAEGLGVALGGEARFESSALRLRFLPPGPSQDWVALEARGSLERQRLNIAQLSLYTLHSAMVGHGTVPIRWDGAKSVDLNGLEFTLAAQPLAYRDLRSFSPVLDREGSIRLRFHASGQGHGAVVHLEARCSDGGSVLVHGLVTRPKDSPVEYRVHVAVRQLNPSLFALSPRRADRVNGDLKIDLRGRRIDQIDGRVQARVGHSRYAAFRTQRTVVEAEFLKGRARINLESEIGIIAVSTQGWLRPFDTVPSYDLTARVWRRSQGASFAWLDRLLEGTGETLSLRVRGHHLNPRQADLQALATLAGSHRLADTRIDLRLQRGAARLIARTVLDGAALDLDAVVYPFSSHPTLTVRRVRFDHLNLARLVPDTALVTDLSGSGTVHARGRRLRDLTLSGRIALDDSRVGSMALKGGNLEGSFSRGDLEFRVELDAPAGRLALAGVTRPFDSIPSYTLRQGTFQALDLSQLLGVDRLRTHLTGSLQADGTGRRPENARITALLTLDRSVVNQTAIQRGRLQVALTDGRLRLIGNVLGEGDSAAIDATIEGRLGGREPTRLRGELRARGSFGGISVDSLQAALQLADGVLAVDTLSIRSNIGSVGGEGTIALLKSAAARDSRFRLEGRLSDIAPLASILGVEGLGVDSGGFTASISGPSERLHLRLGIDAVGLALGSRRLRAMQASFEGDLAADRSVATGTADLRLERLVLPGGSVRMVLLQGSYREREFALRGESVMDRARHARVVARVDATPSERRVLLDTLEVKTANEHWTLRHPVTITYGDQIQVNDFVLAAGGRRIAVDGMVDRRGEQRLSASVDSLRLGWLTTLLGIGELDGEVNGSFSLTGPAAAPHATGDLAVVLHSLDEVVSSVRGRLDWDSPRGLRLDLGVRHAKGDSLRLTARVPLALSLVAGDSSPRLVTRIPQGELSLDAAADDFRIDIFEPLVDPEIATAFRGRLSLDAHARGSMNAPELSGELTLTDARVRVPRLGATYDKGQIRLALQGNEIRLTQARIESGGGRIEAQGAIRLQSFPAATLDLSATMHNFQIAAGEDFRSKISGTLHLGGVPSAPVLTGSVQLRNLDFYLQMRNLARSAEEVELTPADLRVLEERFGYTVDQQLGKAHGALSPWALDLDVTFAGGDWLRRRTDPVVAVELSGKLAVRKAHGEDIRLFGTIRPVSGRSFVQVLGRRFEVTDGAVDLNGPLKDARMRLHAEYRVDSPRSATAAGVRITVQVQVDTGKLALTLGSTPPMEQVDIRSYLATGGPASTDPTPTTDETGVLTTGASLAVDAALGSVAGGAGQRLGLDVVQILQDHEGGQTLVAGKYVSPPLYLGFRQPIIPVQELGQPKTTWDAMEFEVEYAALRRALLNFQGAGSEFRVFLRLRR